MKTKSIFMSFLFLGVVLTKLSAQDWPPFVEPTGTKSMAFATDWFWGYSVAAYCINEQGDFEQVDYLTGTAYAHCVWHYVNGVYVWARVSSHGEAIGESGEVFKIQEIDKEITSLGINPWHYNFIGNKGTHYIGVVTWDFINDPDGLQYVVSKAACPENRNKKKL